MKYVLVIFIFASMFLLASCSTNTIEGCWEGEDEDGNKGKMIFTEDNFKIINNEEIIQEGTYTLEKNKLSLYGQPNPLFEIKIIKQKLFVAGIWKDEYTGDNLTLERCET